ncbi:MAG: antibiotic biosynthesis monooxygenase family protein [Roseicyclus sp.]
MHCLFFDVRPKPGHLEHYFAHVDRLKPRLAAHDGMLYLERFRPLDDPEALLSHQLWRDEAAIAAWRRDGTHRSSQAAGRRVHFEDYRIRVGPAVAEWPGGVKAPEGGGGRLLLASYGLREAGNGGRTYESVTRPGYLLALTEAAGAESAAALAEAALTAGADKVRLFGIARDYTLTDRAEAPGD